MEGGSRDGGRDDGEMESRRWGKRRDGLEMKMVERNGR